MRSGRRLPAGAAPRTSLTPSTKSTSSAASTISRIRRLRATPTASCSTTISSARDLAGKNVLARFPARPGTRELKAQDFEYQIKRLAHPRLHSPIFGLMTDYIVGLKEYAER